MDNTPIGNVSSLVEKINYGFKPDYLFFWGHHARKDGRIGKQCLSQWWYSPFQIGNISYPTAEHYLMAEKARLFGDKETHSKILSSTTPDEAKRLGRNTIGFDEAVWTSHRVGIALRANAAKFSQNDVIGKFLLDTGEKILVEASPQDTIWGIGLPEEDPRAAIPQEWQGLNILGFVLMAVRFRLCAGKPEKY